MLATLLFSLVGAYSPRAIHGSPQSTQLAPEFKEVGDLLVGRWMGQVELEIDYSGIGKKGDKITVYRDCGWQADGGAVECKEFDGPATSTVLYVWDRIAKRAKFLSTDSAGNMDEGTLVRRGPKLMGTSISTLPDGTRAEYAWESTFEDNGRTQISVGSTTLAGHRTEWRAVFERASP